MLKQSISPKLVLKTMLSANRSGKMTPARFDRFAPKALHWASGHIDRLGRQTNAANSAYAIPDIAGATERLRNAFGSTVTRAAAARNPLTDVTVDKVKKYMPKVELDSARAPSGSVIDFSANTVQASPHWPVALHELGHAADRMIAGVTRTPWNKAYEFSSANKLMEELRANRRAMTLLKNVGGNGAPTVSQYRKAVDPGLSTYRAGTLQRFMGELMDAKLHPRLDARADALAWVNNPEKWPRQFRAAIPGFLSNSIK